MAKKKRFSLSTCILMGLGLGIACGIVFGDYCAPLRTIGNVYIRLLQMTILPYVMISLIYGIGRLSYGQAKSLATKAVVLLLLFWALGLIVILCMPLTFPELESASFFSTSLIEPPKEMDLLSLYIPSNPFASLAQNVVPAVVVFSIAIGIALIGIEEKESLVQNLSILSDAVTRVARTMVWLAPIGVFAIAASASGTTPLEEFARLRVYFAIYIASALLLTFWVLPMFLSACTPVRYREAVGISKDALVTAFTTGSLFIVLPIISENSKTVLAEHELLDDNTSSLVDVVLPVVFVLPSLGKLLSLLFVLFAGWTSGRALPMVDYPAFASSGLLSFFGSSHVAIPFLLDSFRIPVDLFRLFLLAGIVIGRFAVLLAAMHLFSLVTMAACASHGGLTLKPNRLGAFALTTVGVMAAVLIGLRVVFSMFCTETYTKDKMLASMHLLSNPVEAVVHRTVPPPPADAGSKAPLLEKIHKRGVLRVGYNPDNLPWAFFNHKDELVGFDVEMAHVLARDLGVTLEFIPVTYDTFAKQVNENQVDIVMSGIVVTPPRAEDMVFSASYVDVRPAFLVRDYRRDDFSTRERVQALEGLRIGVPAESYLQRAIGRYLPKAELVTVKSFGDFFENYKDDLDAMLVSAEGGSAWSLLYPEFQAVIPRPDVVSLPVAYPIGGRDKQMAEYVSWWIDLKKRNKTVQKIYDHWILGRGAERKGPRWSVIRNVLHWVD